MFMLDYRLIEEDLLSLHKNSLALQYGFSLFESIYLENGRLQYFDEHIERLEQSCLELKLPSPPLNKQLLRDFFAKSSGTLCAKIIYFENNGHFSLLAKTEPIKPLAKDCRLRIAKERRHSSQSLKRHKTGNYLENYLLKRSCPHTEWIFLDENAHVLEGTSSNIFWKKDGIYYTPSLELNILAGIMRAKIIDELKKASQSCIEGKFKVEALFEAEQIFISNSLRHKRELSI